VGVSFTYALSALAGFQRPVDVFPAGETSVRRALELDARLADAHHFLGAQAFFFRWDWADAEREFRMAESLGGSNQDPDLLREWALHRWALGRIEEAIALARQAREVDPVSPGFAVALADYLLHASQLEEAADLYEEAIRDDPTDARAYFGLAEVRRLQVRFDDAIEARRRGHLAVGDDSLDETFRTAKGEMGYRRIEEAAVRRELEGLNERVQQAYASPLDFARAYAQLGETEKAFSYFELAFADRAAGLVFLNVDRAWDRLRKDPRFESAVRRVGLS
jgi:tetratricopeptide (TPR) repeat protein